MGASVPGVMEQALDLADAVDLLRPLDERVDQVLRRQLAAQLHDALLRVDADRALDLVLVAEELRLDLVLQRRVVVVLRMRRRDQAAEPSEQRPFAPMIREEPGHRRRPACAQPNFFISVLLVR